MTWQRTRADGTRDQGPDWPRTRGGAGDVLQADWHHQIFVHPRYRELFDQRVRGELFSVRDLRDLQMWSSLAWFGQEFREAPAELVTGETVTVHRFVEQRAEFSARDVEAMVEDQYRILRAIVPMHRALQDGGQIELTTWTFSDQRPTVAAGDWLIVRTNCPGTLHWRADGMPECALELRPVGGVLAGARRFQAAVGPVEPLVDTLAFRVLCGCPGCRCEDACCAGGWHTVEVRRPGAP